MMLETLFPLVDSVVQRSLVATGGTVLASKLALNCKYEIELFTSNILLAGLEILSDIALTLSLLVLLFFLETKLTIILISTFFIFMYLYQFILKKRSFIWASERQKYG